MVRGVWFMCFFLCLFWSQLLLTRCAFAAAAAAETNDDRVLELLHRQSTSKDGVIHLDDGSFRRFMSATSSDPRSYSLVVFFDAMQQRHGSCFQGFLLRRRVHTIATSLPTLRNHNASAHQACSSGEWKRWCIGRDEPVWVPSKCRRNGVVCTSQNQAKVCCNRAAASYKQNADVVPHRSFPRDNSLHHQETDCPGFALARADCLVLNGNPSVFLQRLRWDAQHHSKHAALHARPKPSWQAYLLLPRLRHAVGNRGFRGRLSLHCGGIAFRFPHTLCSSDQIQTFATDCDAPSHRYQLLSR